MKKALFIGHGYIDITFITDSLPKGDEKLIAEDYTVTYGGNAVSAGFTAAKLAKNDDVRVDLLMNMAYDYLGEILRQMCDDANIRLHPQLVERSSPSLIFPKDGERAIVRMRDDTYLKPYPSLDMSNYAVVHADGHLAHLVTDHLKRAQQAGVLTSFDGGNVRKNTEDLLPYLDVAAVSELFHERLNKGSVRDTLDYLKYRGVKIPCVTLGKKGLAFYDEQGNYQELSALPIPEHKIVDTNGAGDIFHGGYVYSYLNNPHKTWKEHFMYGRACSAHSVQYLGHLNSAPTPRDVEAVMEMYG